MQFVDLLFLGDVGEVGLKRLEVVEFARRQEVQEVKQFFKIVLKGSAGQQEFKIDAVAGQNSEKL
jgi:hypothetical protein